MNIKQVHINLSEDKKRKLEKIAEKQERTVSNQIRYWIRKHSKEE